MAYRFAYTERFSRHHKKLTAQEKSLLGGKLALLAENPFHPSLHTKRIQGSDGLFECSVNMDIRLVWCYEGSETMLLVDIGHHNILEKY